MPSKNKKHAKESGGISAAVTKQAAGKLSSNNRNYLIEGGGTTASNKSTASDTSTPPANTPEIKPSTSPDDGNPIVASPMLDAFSTVSTSPNTAPIMTTEWAKSIMAGSPGNLINLSSESPPTQPSSYEEAARLHNGWAAGQRPLMSPSPASPSPPNHARRPLSLQSDAHYHIAGTPPRSSAAYRRSSLYSQLNTTQTASPHPPLPHQAQPHFYGAQDLDLAVTSQSSMKAGDGGLFFGFDTLPPGPGTSAQTQKVVLAGYQGGLQVYAVNKRGVELVASLKGLRGGVHHAKILPWTVTGQNSPSFPLVAVVVHGPVLPTRLTDVGGQRETVSRQTPDYNASPRPAGHAPSEGQSARAAPTIQFYQTAVEVYSLSTNRLVDVLLQTQRVPINTEVSLSSPLFQPPSPSGALDIKADDGNIAVCSGITGECWIYRQLLELQNGHMFACAGKLWTTIQQSQRAEVAEEAGTNGSSSSPRRSSPQTPIFAMNGRWIAYCPSTPSSQASLRAHLPVPTLGRAPGVLSMAPPHLPALSSAVDLPISDGMMNKFMRETTQELISGMKWVGQQSLQAWNSYWSQPPTSQQQHQHSRSSPAQWTGSRAQQADPSQFPPTHGTSTLATVKEPGLVSIVDLEKLPSHAAVHPLSTFATPLGCSFVSFSPSALALFTASTKGDVQTVWDLLRIQHTNSSPLQTTLAHHETIGPQVRQIAQFSRMTVARIVEVAWSEPHGDRLAMVTERGTIHLLDMPFSSFMWPPPRRRRIARKGGPEASEGSSSAVSMASGALGAAYQAAKPFVSRSRRGSSNTVSPSPGNMLRDSAAQGGRVIAASISHSLGKTGTAINQLRHTGENRVSLPPSAVLPSPACVSWLRNRRSQSLFSIAGGLVRVFPCSTRTSSSAPGKKISRANKYKDIRVPLLPNDIVAPVVRQMLELGDAEEYLELSEAEMDAGNTMTLKAPHVAAATQYGMDAAIPQAEIESSAPYQPFHTDRRVALCEYGRRDSVSVLLASVSLDDEVNTKKNKQNSDATKGQTSAWAFGQDIPFVRVDLGLAPTSDDGYVGPDDHMALPPSAMERIMQYDGSESIVVTTRRRRGARQGEGDEDGFFEDDCEVLDFADQRV
ncbi:WD40/YVTN repeat-like-containing domain protein [Metarhizium album ARSEF 1941]|uniref:WD40/YVTN repeat-like-containing domain protein n=1 Tax=Metarhizium album (strain ARSEF 1941) TaxID=1081103 RepID=A0A0B2WZV2_METAS|nr:WD40/YVTN repeat-like-containing domain protein [Metarhizium album ARSEF 1941]KHN99583.1 WD40/YVTN repeat-like-containing domain protein [Metarhizium album ARSEF 1941]